VVFAVLIALGVPYLRSFVWMSQKALHATLVQTPRGPVAFIGQPGAARLMARIATSPADDGFFFYPYMPLLSFLAARQQVSKYDIFVPGYSLDFEYQDACKSALQYARWLILDWHWMDPHTLKAIFPNIGDASSSATRRFEQALMSSYIVVAREGTFELRHRRGDVSDAVCNGIVE
jgi:hypothetical protein